jgi:predicted transposase YbfD/YdcC
VIIDTKNDYVIGVKMNQRTLCQHIQSMTADMMTVTSRFSEWEYSKGRTERREVVVSDAVGHMDKHWAGLKQIIKVKRMVRDKGKTREEDAYYISSRKVTAQAFCSGIRNHWSIENGLHWVKDMTFKEDASRIRTANAPQNTSIFRNIAINLFRTNDYKNMAQAQRLVANDITKLNQLIN